MAEVPESHESDSSEGDGSSSSKRQRSATSEHGSPSKRQRFESDVTPEERKYSTVSGKGTAFSGDYSGLPDEWLSFIKSRPSDAYTPLVWFEPDAINDNKEILEVMENYHRFRCQDALNHYRDTKGLDYELVEVVKHNDIFMMPLKRFHYNFKAKKRAVDSGRGRDDDDDDDDGSPKLFYADLIEGDYGTYRLLSVMQCEILDPSGPVGNCPRCENGVLHPTDLADRYKHPFWMRVGPLPDYDLPSLYHG